MDIMAYISPSLLMIVPALWILGKMLKDSKRISDKHIPLILGGISIVLAAAQVLATADIAMWKDALSAVFTAVMQGILCAGLAVYGNQIVKQYTNK